MPSYDTTPYDIFAECVRKRGLRMTPQRRLIFEVFVESGAHLTPEELYVAAKQADPSVGQATVYRTLRLLSDCGLAHELHLGDGPTRFEPALGREHHDHLVCDSCGETLEIFNERIEQLQEELAAELGYTLTGHRMVLMGICARCQTGRT